MLRRRGTDLVGRDLFFGAPICATVGLLIGGRRAVFATETKTAAEPPAATLRGG